MKKVIIAILIILAIGVVSVVIYMNRTEPSVCLKEYFDKLNDKDYEGMYEYVETDMSKENFVTRVKNIYEGIEAANISATVLTNTEDESDNSITNVTYNNSMDTLAGNMNFMNTVKVKKVDGEYKIVWNSAVIFPELKDEYKVRVTTLESTRGAIYDRNDIAIAKDGEVYSVGLVPGKMDDTTDLATKTAAITVESKILITNVTARVYPYKEATSLLTGYVQEDEGKTGLEYAYNDRLKGTDGEEIYIADESENKVKTLAKRDLKNGENIKTTIDVTIQQELYNQFKENPGASVAMNYNTGEVLALVSTPAYDANDIVLGVTNDEWNELQNNEQKPMYNRYLSTYVPGSSLKPIVGAIGLSNNSFTADEDFGDSGKRWQNSEEWKDLYVTTLTDYSGPANLKNALIYSDNIYFAKAALKIGKNNLQKGLDNFGFNDKISFVQDITKSTYGSMDSEAALANSGYGQDQMLVNPIHLAMIYSSFANGGNMVMPCLEYTETKYYKQNVISQEIANTIKQDLVQVVEQGTGKEAKIDGKTIAGKTGTAEIKENQQDENGTEIGWFNAFDENGLLVVSMVENVKGKGGSHYLLPKIKTVFE